MGRAPDGRDTQSGRHKDERDRMTESTKSAKLTIDGKEFDLPIFSPTAGPEQG